MPARICELRIVAGGAGCEFTLKDGQTSLANAIRRTMIQDVMSAAVSRVDIHLNDTVLPDEMLSHRLGLVPLLGGSEDDVTFQLDCEGPCVVTSDDLHPARPECGLRFAPGVSLFPLASGQRVSLDAHCGVGCGRDHARFCQCAAPCYAIRHEGVDHPECMCVDSAAAHGARCAKCGDTRPDKRAALRPLVHAFRFESNGGAPLDLLHETLLTLREKVRGMRAALDASALSEGAQ